MKTNNKKKVTLLTLCLLSVLTYMLGSCSGDNDLTGSSDLSINMQIPTTRSADPETPQQYMTDEQRKKKQRETPIYDDECGLYALTEVKKRDGNAFADGDENNTASAYYETMREYAKKNNDYDKGAMTSSTMLAIGKEFNLLTGMMDFSQESSPNEYFSEKENRENARIIFFQKDGEGHYAKVNKVDSKKGEVYFLDSTNKNGTIEIDKVEGVMYYDK